MGDEKREIEVRKIIVETKEKNDNDININKTESINKIEDKNIQGMIINYK